MAEEGVARHVVIVRVPSAGTEQILFTVEMGDRFDEIRLPPGMQVSDVEGQQGPVKYSVQDTGGHSSLTFSPPQSRLTITGSRQSEVVALGHVFSSEFVLGGFSDGRDEIRVFIEVPEGAVIFAASEGAQFDRSMSRASISATGAARVWFTYEMSPSARSEAKVVDAGLFRLYVEPELEEEAAVIGKLASVKLPEVASGAGVQLPWPGPLRVVPYAPPSGSTEEGQYGGRGVIFVNRHLFLSSSDAYPLLGGSVLLHEAFHAVSTPYGIPPDLTWFAEGASVHAQRYLEPSDGYEVCRGGQCTVYGYAISFEELEWMFQNPPSVILAWDLENAPLLYAYAGFIIEAYVERFGADAYQQVWRQWKENKLNSECACDSSWVLNAMAHQAEISTHEVLFPLKDLYDRDRRAFQHEMSHIISEPSNRTAYDSVPWMAIAVGYTPSLSSGIFSPAPQGEVAIPTSGGKTSLLPIPLIVATVAVLGVLVWGTLSHLARGHSRRRSIAPPRTLTPTVTHLPESDYSLLHPPDPMCPGTEDGQHAFEERVFRRDEGPTFYRVCRVCKGAERVSP